MKRVLNGLPSCDSGRISRRGFLRTGVVLGAGLVLSSWVPGAAEAAPHAASRRKHRVETTRFLLGTYVTICAMDASRERAHTAVEAAYAEMHRLSALLNRHDSGTELSELNRVGRLSGASSELLEVLEQSLQLNRISQGVFDPSVTPVVELMRGAGQGEMEAAALREAMQLVGADKIRLNGRKIHLERQGMALTLDGIGKGYVVDRASEVMTRLGVGDHLINAGGDIRASGRPSGERGWRIALEDPKGGTATPAVLELSNMAVATSGAYEQTWGPGRHHIVRPDSGLCPGQCASVSVAAPTVMGADSLATTLFASSPHFGLSLVDSLPGRECLILSSTGARARSRHWQRYEV
ncbi:MAG: FAD:protein FMN transferase [Desulfovibrio sp.]|jgi:thiamine biosynthesis lipoprotein